MGRFWRPRVSRYPAFSQQVPDGVWGYVTLRPAFLNSATPHNRYPEGFVLGAEGEEAVDTMSREAVIPTYTHNLSGSQWGFASKESPLFLEDHRAQCDDVQILWSGLARIILPTGRACLSGRGAIRWKWAQEGDCCASGYHTENQQIIKGPTVASGQRREGGQTVFLQRTGYGRPQRIGVYRALAVPRSARSICNCRRPLETSAAESPSASSGSWSGASRPKRAGNR